MSVSEEKVLALMRRIEARTAAPSRAAGSEWRRANAMIAAAMRASLAQAAHVVDSEHRRITMAKDHGSSVKDDKQYEGLRKKGMSKSRAARIANAPDSSSKGGKASGSGKRKTDSSQGGTKAQKAAAGRKGAKKSNS
jgi:hypothetical protein